VGLPHNPTRNRALHHVRNPGSRRDSPAKRCGRLSYTIFGFLEYEEQEENKKAGADQDLDETPIGNETVEKTSGLQTLM
jgi:hypothetical protein